MIRRLEPRYKRTVIARALANAMMVTTTADIFHANRTALLSCRSGQKRSKKNPAPKMVAMAIPTKILYDATPTKSLLYMVAFSFFLSTKDCCKT